MLVSKRYWNEIYRCYGFDIIEEDKKLNYFIKADSIKDLYRVLKVKIGKLVFIGE